MLLLVVRILLPARACDVMCANWEAAAVLCILADTYYCLLWDLFNEVITLLEFDILLTLIQILADIIAYSGFC